MKKHARKLKMMAFLTQILGCLLYISPCFFLFYKDKKLLEDYEFFEEDLARDNPFIIWLTIALIIVMFFIAMCYVQNLKKLQKQKKDGDQKEELIKANDEKTGM